MTYHLVFDTTDPKSPRFIELEDSTGHSISAGEWRERKDGYVELVLPAPLSKDCTQTSVTPATDDLILAVTSQILGRPKGSRVTLDIPDMLSLIARIHAADKEVLSYKLNQSVSTTKPDSWQDSSTAPMETFEAQIDRLAEFIMSEVPGEPSQSQGAVDTAIRLIRATLPPKPLSYEGEQS